MLGFVFVVEYSYMNKIFKILLIFIILIFFFFPKYTTEYREHATIDENSNYWYYWDDSPAEHICIGVENINSKCYGLVVMEKNGFVNMISFFLLYNLIQPVASFYLYFNSFL